MRTHKVVTILLVLGLLAGMLYYSFRYDAAKAEIVDLQLQNSELHLELAERDAQVLFYRRKLDQLTEAVNQAQNEAVLTAGGLCDTEEGETWGEYLIKLLIQILFT